MDNEELKQKFEVFNKQWMTTAPSADAEEWGFDCFKAGYAAATPDVKLIGASWCKECNDYADDTCLTKHREAINPDRIIPTPVKEEGNKNKNDG